MNLEIRTGINRGIGSVKNNISERKIAIGNKFHSKVAEYKSHDHPIQKKIAWSAGMAVASFFIYEGMNADAIFGSANIPCIKNVIENSPYPIFIGSFVLDYATSFVDGWQNLRLLRNPKIGTSPNFIATSAYYTAEKVIPNRKTIKGFATAIMPSFISENPPLFIAGLTSEQMLTKVAMGRIFTAGITAAQIVGKEIFLRTVGRGKEKIEKEAQTTYILDSKGGQINPKGIVFEPAKVNVENK
jgi:hypothetical protein